MVALQSRGVPYSTENVHYNTYVYVSKQGIIIFIIMIMTWDGAILILESKARVVIWKAERWLDELLSILTQTHRVEAQWIRDDSL